MSFTHDYYLIKERLPNAWTLSHINSVGFSSGNSVYPAPAHALTVALSRDPHVNFEIHVRADDSNVPTALRRALLVLRDAGRGQPRQTYRLSATERAQFGLTMDDFVALTEIDSFIGTAAGTCEWAPNGKVTYELAVAVLGG